MDVSKIKNAIGKTAVFENCKPSTLDLISALPVSEFSSGDIISSGRQLLGIIVFGKIEIRSSDGGRVLMKSASAGEMFGAATVFLGENTISDVIAKTKCGIIFVGREMIEELFASDAGVAVSYAEFLSQKVAFLNKKVASISSPRADMALASHIIETADGKSEFKLNCLAASKKLGIGRTSVYRALKTLEDDGLIRFENGKIIIIDVIGLSSRRNIK